MRQYLPTPRRGGRPIAFLLLWLAGCAGIRIASPANGGFAATDGSVTAVIAVQGGACPSSFQVTLDGRDVTSSFSPLPPASSSVQATFLGLVPGNHLLVARVRAGSGCLAYVEKALFYYASSSALFVVDGENSQLRNDRLIQMGDMTGAGWTAYGGPGAGTGRFAFPRAVAVYGIGTIYVTDQVNNRVVQVSDMNGAGWTTLGTYGWGPGHFNGPTGIAIDARMRVYVADSGSDQLIRYHDMTGAGWTAFGGSGGGVGRFRGPTGVALDAAGRIYVADSVNDRIVRIDDMTGAGWTSFGSPGGGVGQFNGVGAVAIDASGRIYATDSANCRVVRINDMTGAGWTALGTCGSGALQFDGVSGQLLGIWIDTAGQIYVTDLGNGRLVRMDDMTGDGWTTLGSYGTGTNQFVSLNGVFVKPPALVIAP